MSIQQDVFSFPYKYHGNMLKDRHRMQIYDKAIRDVVGADSNVVDMGTGTGILAAMAARLTSGRVAGIDIEPSCIFLAKLINRSSSGKEITFIESDGLTASVDFEPNVLITETIGQVGPEEATVELCHSFKQRYPSISCVMPMAIEIWIEPIQSDTLEKVNQQVLSYFTGASIQEHDYSVAEPFLLDSFCQKLETGNLSGKCTTVGEPQQLIRYDLGVTESSSFERKIDISQWKGDTSALHLYFRVFLTQDLILTNHYSDVDVHWSHNFIPFHSGLPDTLVLGYNAFDEKVSVNWE